MSVKVIRKVQVRSKPASYYLCMEDGEVTFTPNLYKAAAIPDAYLETTLNHLNLIGEDAGWQVEAIREGVA